MKKNLLVVFVLLIGVLFFGSQAGAVSFTAVGTDVEFGGIGFGSYCFDSTSVSFDIYDGESITKDLFDIIFTETSIGIGTVEATIDIIDPDLGEGTQDGFYAGLSVVGNYNFTTGFIDWGDPIEWIFDSGILSLNLVDIYALCCDTIYSKTITIEGIFSFEDSINTTVPVPEPTTMLLLGTGLIGVCMVSRKRWIKN